jgi:hypothetical protein
VVGCDESSGVIKGGGGGGLGFLSWFDVGIGSDVM